MTSRENLYEYRARIWYIGSSIDNRIDIDIDKDNDY